MNLNDLQILIDAEEKDDYSSWVSATSYRTVLNQARKDCPPDRHVVTLYEYMSIWMDTVMQGSRACNEADVWMKFENDKNLNMPISKVRHPFKSTVLADTYLTEFSYKNNTYEALVVEKGEPKERIIIPPIGKIYEINNYGIPSKTGGAKVKMSNAFEHRWWAFSSDQLRDSNGNIDPNFSMALFANGGTIGCFCELIKAHYSLDDAGGFYRVLTLTNL